MLRRTSLAPISDNKTVRKELDLLTKGKIAGEAELGATSTQISRNLNVPRITVNGILNRLQTAPFEVNKPRSERPFQLLLEQLGYCYVSYDRSRKSREES